MLFTETPHHLFYTNILSNDVLPNGIYLYASLRMLTWGAISGRLWDGLKSFDISDHKSEVPTATTM